MKVGTSLFNIMDKKYYFLFFHSIYYLIITHLYFNFGKLEDKKLSIKTKMS
jgi:hypothetical protein